MIRVVRVPRVLDTLLCASHHVCPVLTSKERVFPWHFLGSAPPDGKSIHR